MNTRPSQLTRAAPTRHARKEKAFHMTDMSDPAQNGRLTSRQANFPCLLEEGAV